jgi:hypothetical protein
VKALALLALVACGGRDAEPSGVGPYTFTYTTLSTIHHGDCQVIKGDDGRSLTWCFGLGAMKIAKRNAEVNLYFLGHEPDAKLIEIQLSVRGCLEDELDSWMRTAMGAPIDQRPGRAYWKNGYMWAAAKMPSEPGRCLVHFVPLSEESEIARIKTQ